MRLEVRLCPHDNLYKERDRILLDSSIAQFDVIRVVLSPSTAFGLTLGCIYIQGDYLQSGPINRELYIRPHKSVCSDVNIYGNSSGYRTASSRQDVSVLKRLRIG